MGVKLKLGASAGQIMVKTGPLHLVPSKPKDSQQFTRQKTIVVDGGFWVTGPEVRSERPRSLTFISAGLSKDLVLEGNRPKSELITVKPEREAAKPRIPVLGPTRQQTELYLKKMSRRKTDHSR